MKQNIIRRLSELSIHNIHAREHRAWLAVAKLRLLSVMCSRPGGAQHTADLTSLDSVRSREIYIICACMHTLCIVLPWLVGVFVFLLLAKTCCHFQVDLFFFIFIFTQMGAFCFLWILLKEFCDFFTPLVFLCVWLEQWHKLAAAQQKVKIWLHV